jgi:hypothetical protein
MISLIESSLEIEYKFQASSGSFIEVNLVNSEVFWSQQESRVFMQRKRSQASASRTSRASKSLPETKMSSTSWVSLSHLRSKAIST